MFVLPLVLALNLAVTVPIAKPPEAAVTANAVLAELNRARTDPTAYARSLNDSRAYYHGHLLRRPGADATYLTEEGVAPLDEAVSFVSAKAVQTPLSPAEVLAAAAADHQAEQSVNGAVGHAGLNGSTPADRVRRRGGNIYVGELIAYGSTDAADIVRQLVVDDGVADRGHRRLLFDPSLRYAGVACGNHPVYRYMCVVTLGRTPDGQPLRHGTSLHA